MNESRLGYYESVARTMFGDMKWRNFPAKCFGSHLQVVSDWILHQLLLVVTTGGHAATLRRHTGHVFFSKMTAHTYDGYYAWKYMYVMPLYTFPFP